MPEDIKPTAPAPDPAVPVTSVVATEPVVPEATPQGQAREAIYKRYYAEPEPAAPVPPAAPIEPEPVQTDPKLAALESQIADLKRLLEAKSAATPPPGTPDPLDSLSPEDAFVEAYAKGDRKRAFDIITKAGADRAQQEVITRSLEMFRVETEIQSFITDLRGKNPDLMPLEELITSKAKARLDEADKEGKIKSGADYVREYKGAVTAALEDTRKLYQTIRGSGKDEALTARTQVLSSTAVSPTAVDANRGAITKPAEAPLESTQDYLKARAMKNLVNHRLAVQQ